MNGKNVISDRLLASIAIMVVLVIALGFYFRQMRRQANELEAAATETLPVAPPPTGPTETVTLWVANDAAGQVRAQSATLPLPADRQQRAAELLRALLRVYQQPSAAHTLPPASDIRSLFLIDPGVAIVDLNAAFADQHRSGILVEQLTVNSIVETVAANVPGIQRVRILVDGKTRDTLAGHVDLTQPFDVQTITQAAGGQ